MRTFKTVFFLVLAVGILVSACAENSSNKNNTKEVKEDKIMENQDVIKLSTPDLERGVNVMKALNIRKSVREYGDKELGLSDLSDLLWAANGINRPELGKRTAPSAVNAQDIDIYVCMKDGAYLYDAKENSLKRITTEDLRPAVAGGQDFVKEAPVSVVLVSDISRFPGEDVQRKTLMGAMDAGIVSENISLFCASVGLETVPRASMDAESLKKSLVLTDSQIPLMNHPVGYTKE